MRQLLFNSTGGGTVFGHFGAVGRYALAARRGMYEFSTGPKTWKHIAMGQRKWANLNPAAIMHEKPMEEEDYYSAPMVVEPFRLFDNCQINDGGRAIIVTSYERARDLKQPPVLIMGMGQHNPSNEIGQAKYMAGPTGAKKAGETAFKTAGINIGDIDACQIYDCFTYTVELTMQDYGFFKYGEGEDWFEGGTIEPAGRMPVNTSGGQLSEAYFMGLTPISEAVMQLMGRCGDRQLGPKTNTKEPRIILCSDNGGISTVPCLLHPKEVLVMPFDKLLPTPDADSKPFWAGCRNHKLMFQKCADCGEVRWPPSILCPQCHSQDTQWIESGGKGTIYTFVVYHQAFHPAFKDKLPYVAAVVQLEEGPMMLTNIIGCPHESLKCEMAVRVTWDDVSDEFSLPKFQLIA